MKSGSVYWPAVPRLVLLRGAVQPGGVARELPERDLADVAAAGELGHVFGDGIVERDLAVLDRLRQQGRGKHLADRGQVEQRVRGDRLLARDVGHAVVVEQGAAVDVDRDRHAAGGDQHRLHVPPDQLLDLGIALGARDRRRNGGGDGGDADRRHQCQRSSTAPHRCPPVARHGGTRPERAFAGWPDFNPRAAAAELIRVHRIDSRCA